MKTEYRTKGRGRTIKVDYLARVEGEGTLYVRIKDGTVVDVQLKIFEPPGSLKRFCVGGNTPKHRTSQLAYAVSAPLPIR